MFLCLKKLANTFTKTLVTFHPASSHMRRSPRGQIPCSPEDPTSVRINPTLVVQWDDYPRGQRAGISCNLCNYLVWCPAIRC
jgi:hypothetical protein